MARRRPPAEGRAAQGSHRNDSRSYNSARSTTETAYALYSAYVTPSVYPAVAEFDINHQAYEVQFSHQTTSLEDFNPYDRVTRPWLSQNPEIRRVIKDIDTFMPMEPSTASGRSALRLNPSRPLPRCSTHRAPASPSATPYPTSQHHSSSITTSRHQRPSRSNLEYHNRQHDASPQPHESALEQQRKEQYHAVGYIRLSDKRLTTS
ncbi:hypothetical protein ACN47E_001324 [Coniothyrium glycines]